MLKTMMKNKLMSAVAITVVILALLMVYRPMKSNEEKYIQILNRPIPGSNYVKPMVDDASGIILGARDFVMPVLVGL